MTFSFWNSSFRGRFPSFYLCFKKIVEIRVFHLLSLWETFPQKPSGCLAKVIVNIQVILDVQNKQATFDGSTPLED